MTDQPLQELPRTNTWPETRGAAGQLTGGAFLPERPDSLSANREDGRRDRHDQQRHERNQPSPTDPLAAWRVKRGLHLRLPAWMASDLIVRDGHHE